ncbi:MAG: hypothetical protein ACREIW_10810 [Chthoniobacterales bacterium]
MTSLIFLSSISCFAESLYFTVKSTPYDRQMNRIQPVLFSKPAAPSRDLSLKIVNQWIGDLREIPYGFSSEWKTPAEVESEPVADCKGKAVVLYQRMLAHGAENIRLVIGRRTQMSRRTHAWVEWATSSGTYVLDPTINWTACRMDHLGHGAYVPFYAYSGPRKFRAASASLFAVN